MRGRAATLLAAACLLAAAAGTGGLAVPAGAHPSDSATDADHDNWNSPPLLPGEKEDNCPEEYNNDQRDLDSDGAGDKCDLDDDQDGVEDLTDNCDEIINPGQRDLDGDGDGDPCDVDDDGDRVEDATDNCPRDPNADQADSDGNRLGDACDAGSPRKDPEPGAEPGDGGLTPAPAPDGGGGTTGPGAGPPDREAPALRLSLSRAHRLETVERGISLRARCSERCGLTAQVLADARTARRLKIGRAAMVVGTGDGALEAAGDTFVFTSLDRRLTRALARGRTRKASLTVRLIALDGAENRQTTTRRITVRR